MASTQRAKSKQSLSEDWVFLTDEKASSRTKKPFLETFLSEKNVSLPYVSLIEEVKLSKQQEGYNILTEDFLLYAWKSNKSVKMLIEALLHFSEKGSGNVLAVAITEIKENNEGKITPTWSIIANKKTEPIVWFVDTQKKHFSVFPISLAEEYVLKANPLI